MRKSLLLMVSILLNGISLLAQENRSMANPVNFMSVDYKDNLPKTPSSSFKNSLQPPENVESFATFINGELYALDSTIYYQRNFLTNDWKQSKKDEFFYDENGRVNEILNYYKDHILNSWVLSLKFEYQYDISGNVTQKMKFSWDSQSNAWRPNSKRQWIYNHNDFLVEYYQFDWNHSTNLWKGSRKITYDYDEDNNLLQFTDYGWDQNLNDWRYVRKYEYHYSADFKDVEIYDYYFDGSFNDWKIDSKEIVKYNSKNLISECIPAYWLENLNEWLFMDKSVFSYDSFDNQIEEKRFEIDTLSNEWVYIFSILNDITYGNNGKILQDSVFYIQDYQDYTYGIIKYNYGYDDHDNLIEYTVSNWYNHNKEWVEEQKEEYFYRASILSSKKVSLDADRYVFYPNPAKDVLYFNRSDIDTVLIYDLNGKMVMNQHNSGNQMHISHLPDGIYLVNLVGKDGVNRKILVKQ